MSESEFYISVDVETAGPNPGCYAMLSIGACTILETAKTFYVEFKPDRDEFQPEALAVSGLCMDELTKKGKPSETAMQAFEDWIENVTPPNYRPIFVAFNAPFDWMFVNDYFHRYLGHNPFGHSALDIKAFFMGAHGVNWKETNFDEVTKFYNINHPLSHNALQDALDQAKLFRKMLETLKGDNR